MRGRSERGKANEERPLARQWLTLGSECAVEPRKQPGLVLLLQLVLPNPQHAPAAGAECAGDEPVAGLVAGDLLAPELRVVFRLRAVDRAAVPDLSASGGNSHRRTPPVSFLEKRNLVCP